MIVDCHTHINCPGDDVDPSGHLAATETVDSCIVLALPPLLSARRPASRRETRGQATADKGAESSREVNEKLSEYVSKHKAKMVGFAFVEPTKDKTSVKNLAVVRDKLGLAGTVLYCSECGFHPTHSKAMRLYESAQELGLPVFFHSSEPLGPAAILEYAQPFLLDEVAREFSALKIVIGTMGVPFVEQTLSMVAKHENVYADLTLRVSNIWQVYNIVVSAHERGVMDKLLFGSGFPFGNPGECIETLLGFNKLLADTNLPTVPRGNIQNIIERDTLELLKIRR